MGNSDEREARERSAVLCFCLFRKRKQANGNEVGTAVGGNTKQSGARDPRYNLEENPTRGFESLYSILRPWRE